MITKNFTIPLADEPYLDTTALNKTHAATYVGPRYLKITVDSATSYVERVVSGADTMDEMNQLNVPLETGKTYHIKNLSDKIIMSDDKLLEAFDKLITGVA